MISICNMPVPLKLSNSSSPYPRPVIQKSMSVTLGTRPQFENELPKDQPVKITFRYPLTPQTVLTWDTILLKKNLYIEVPNGCLPDASKEAFVALLEYAEETLNCEHAIVCFPKDRADRQILIRTFMFIGFFIVPPGNELIPSDNDHIYMVYNMN